MDKNIIYTVALVLTIIGAINWGFIGLISFNVVVAIFGFAPAIVRLIYILVGIAAIYVAIVIFGTRAKL